MVPTMSAEEVLRFHAALRLGSSMSRPAQAAKVESTLQALGLARARNTQVTFATRQDSCRGATPQRLSIRTASLQAASIPVLVWV